MSTKQAVMERINDDEEQVLRSAVSWKYGITDEAEIGRRIKRLRKTDIQDLIWEFEDFNLDG